MRTDALLFLLTTFLFPTVGYAQCTLVSSGETRPIGTIIHNADHNVLQTCTNDGTWKAMTPVASAPSGPPGCPGIGDTCADGTIFAGFSPDGDVWMYTTAVDTATGRTWSSEGPLFPTTGATSRTNGASNTVSIVGTSGTHLAASDCNDLPDHGNTDWYLPSIEELIVLYENRTSIGGFASTEYWSSTEPSQMFASTQDFSDGTEKTIAKSGSLNVRCVRKE